MMKTAGVVKAGSPDEAVAIAREVAAGWSHFGKSIVVLHVTVDGEVRMLNVEDGKYWQVTITSRTNG